jgi:uncharacterized protein YndB with AHSA1/START domain
MTETQVSVQFVAVSPAETELILTHKGISQRDIADRYQGGWGKIATLLEQHLEKRRNPVKERVRTSDIQHAITIDAPADQIYPLVATAKGFTSWWAEDITEDPGGDAVELGFFRRTTVYRLERQTTEPPRKAEWSCRTGQEWAGTRLVFRLEPAAKGTLLHFTHAGWKAETEYFVACNTTWGELIFRLKAAAEGNPRGPLFRVGSLVY